MESTKIRVRKLTALECFRLMGFKDEDFYKAKQRMNEECYGGKDRSQSQLYKQAGNSIVVDVLVHIMRNLKNAMPYLFEDVKVGSFFSGIGAYEKALTVMCDEENDENQSTDNSCELTQVGYINSCNSAANRIYDNKISRTLWSEAGGAEPRQDGIK